MNHIPLILVCSISIACAQEIITLEKIDVQATQQTLEERKENSIAKRIVTGAELTQYGDINALEILKRTPGVTIPDGKKKKGAPGKGYTKVLVDGEEVYTGSRRSGSPLEQINPDMIERIEVMTNGSAEYSAEAMGGVVNIILKKPKATGRTSAKLSAGFYGDAPMATLFGQHEQTNGNWSYLANVTVSDINKEDRESSFQQGTTNIHEFRDNEFESQTANMTAKLFYTPSSKNKYIFDTFAMLTDTINDTLERGYDISTSVLTNMRSIHETNDGLTLWIKLGGEHHISDTELVDWKVKYHESNQQSDSISSESLPGSDQIVQVNDSILRLYGAEGSYSRVYEDHFIKTGIDLKYLEQNDDVHHYENLVDTTQSGDYSFLKEKRGALYIQDEVSIGNKTIVTPGVRYETIRREFTSTYKTDFIAPSLHILYKLTEQDNLRSSVARTFKIPRMDELSTSMDSALDQNDILNPDLTGNPNLREESALSYELRYEHYFQDKGIISIGGFYRDINDKIEKLTTYESGRYVQRPYNAGEGNLYGIELEMKKQLNEFVKGVGVFANATLQDSSLTANGFTRPIKQTNDYTYNVGLDHTLSQYKVTYGAAYRYVGGYDDPIDENGFSQEQKGYGTLDFYASKRLSEMFKVGVNVKNILRATIDTTSQLYSGGTLVQTQIDQENSRASVLLTLEGKW